MAVDLTGYVVLGFRIEQLIGVGGMATVWLARHETLGKIVAIKALDPLLARDAALVQRFVEEAKIQCNLRHPGIIAIENFSQDPLAILMEYVDGRSLSEMIGKVVGPIPFDQAQPLMLQTLAAVGYAHQQGVIHRDLKPANILVTSAGTIKVVDFGIAKILGGSKLTQTGATMGTAAYMAPEQIKGAKNVDRRSDIYSLGATFYEMLAGRTPFESDADTENDFEIRTAHVQQAPPDPRQFYPAIPEGAVVVLLRALAKDPAQRFQNAEEMMGALGSVSASGGGFRAAALPTARTMVETPSEPPIVLLDHEILEIKQHSNKNIILIAIGLCVVLIAVILGLIVRIQSPSLKEPILVQSTVPPQPPPTSHLPSPPPPSPPRIEPKVTVLTGNLHISSNPAGADVFLDNRLVGVTPVSIDQPSNQKYNVKIRARGYLDWSNKIYLQPGGRKRLSANLIKPIASSRTKRSNRSLHLTSVDEILADSRRKIRDRVTSDDILEAAVSRSKKKHGEVARPAVASLPLPENDLPETLSREQIQSSMRRIKPRIQSCFDRFKVPGLASVKITISRSGQVSTSRVKGVFAGTPTGGCVQSAARSATFPKFKGSSIGITYPFILR